MAQVASPDLFHDGPTADAFTQSGTQEPREVEFFRPRESGPSIEVDRLEFEHSGTGHDSGVLDAHPMRRLPIGDFHTVNKCDRPDFGVAQELRSNASSL